AAVAAASAEQLSNTSNTISPSSTVMSPPPQLPQPVAEDPVLSRYPPVGQQPQQSDLRSRRRGMHTSSEFGGSGSTAPVGGNMELTLTQAIEMADELSAGSKASRGDVRGSTGLTLFPMGSPSSGGGSRGGSPAAAASGPYEPASSLASATAASAPTSPMRDNSGSKSHAPYRLQELTLAPITPFQASLSADPIFDLKLAWTEDISSLENNYVRYSMRTPLVAKQTPLPDVGMSVSSAASNRSGGFQQSPRRETVAGMTNVDDEGGMRSAIVASAAGAVGSPLLRVASGDISPAFQRTRAASSASALSNFVPPGLRSSSRDASHTAESSGLADSGSISHQQALLMPLASPFASHPPTSAGAAAEPDADGKEWLNTASVEQLKEELLVNYGQYCRMEASYQKLRDLYASVIDQLLETRESLHQERSKRIECENALRTFQAHAPTDLGEASQQAKAVSAAATTNVAAGTQRTRTGAADSQSRSNLPKIQSSSSRGTTGRPSGSGQTQPMARQPSLRRQRQARRHDTAADHNNDSGSDAEDAIITTVPQKATKRFIWPFGGSRHGDETTSGDHVASSVISVAGGGGSKNSMDVSTQQQHSFHLASTFRASKCDHCQERLKTFTNSVVRCRHCGFVCHQRCANEVTASCSLGEAGVSGGAAGAATVGVTGGRAGRGTTANGQATSGGVSNTNDAALMYDPSVPFQADKMFGRALIEQTSLEGRMVPWVVRAAIAFIEAEGLTMEGVYRRSGSTMDIRAVQMEITRVATATGNQFSDEPAIATSETDVTSVTSVLKQYFRDLPNPVMTSETYHLWVQASNIVSSEERVKVYRTISDSMPQPHSETLRYLMTHLKRVADHQQDNKMTPNNLSVVFAPNILHMGKNDVLQEMANMSGISRTVSFLIQNADEIWATSSSSVVVAVAEGGAAKSKEEEVAATASGHQHFARPPMRRLKDMNILTVNGFSSSPGSPTPQSQQPVDIAGSAVDGLGHALENTTLSQSMPSPKEMYFGMHSDSAGTSGVPDRLASHHQRNINASSGVHQKSSFDLPRNK
ncbi:Rho-type gtpase-activating protein, partial [Coemansia aciculifera]